METSTVSCLRLSPPGDVGVYASYNPVKVTDDCKMFSRYACIMRISVDLSVVKAFKRDEHQLIESSNCTAVG